MAMVHPDRRPIRWPDAPDSSAGHPHGPDLIHGEVRKGARIFATWGAKAGDAPTTSTVTRLGHDVALGHDHDPVGGGGHELDVVGGDDHRAALGRQRSTIANERARFPV